MINTLRRMRWIAAAAVTASLAVAIAGAGKLEFDSHYTAYFDETDVRLIEHLELSARFARHDGLVVALRSEQGFLNDRNYGLLEELSDELAHIPAVTASLSITGLGIAGETLTVDGELIPTLAQLQADSRAPGLLLSEDEILAVIWLQVKLPDRRSQSVLDIMQQVRETTDAILDSTPISAHYTGTLALNEAYIHVVRSDLSRIVPLLLLSSLIVLGGLLGSARAALLSLPVAICATFAAFGTAGLFGARLAAINAFAPIMILCISTAGCVHMALTYMRRRDAGDSSSAAARAAAGENRLPMALAHGSTALGFLGLSLSPSPPIQMVGYLVATGIAVSFVLSLTLLPVLQARFDPWRPTRPDMAVRFASLATLVNGRRAVTVTAFLLLSLPAGWFALQNTVDDNVLEYFDAGHTFHRDTRLVDEHLSGINEILFTVDSGSPLGVFDAHYVEQVDALSNWLRQQSEVRRVSALTDTALIRDAIRDGRLQERLDFHRRRAESEQGAGPAMALEISEDFAAVAVSVFLVPLDTQDLLAFDARVKNWSAANMPDLEVSSGGPTLLFAALGEQNVRGMLTALGLALLGAGLLLGAVLQSARIAWVGLICNLLPVLLVYAIWGIADGRLSIGAAAVLGMILGIVLDDSVYLLTAYRRGRQLHTDPTRQALQRVGPALLITSAALVAGLSFGLLSDFGPIWTMSLLSAAVIGTALLIDLLLLPALLPRDTSSEAPA